MTTDDIGQAAVLLIGILTVLCNLPIVTVLTVEFLRHWRSGDRNQTYRLVIVSLVLQATVILIWRMLIWVDINFADGHWLGRTAMRWRLDLTVGMACQALAGYPAYIFGRDRFRSWQERRRRKQTV